MNHNKYSHLGGGNTVPLDVQKEVEMAISGVTVKPAQLAGFISTDLGNGSAVGSAFALEA